MFTNKQFGNYEYGNGCLIEYVPLTRIDGQALITTTKNCANGNNYAVKNESVIGREHAEFTLPVTVNKIPTISTNVTEVSPIERPQILRLDAIDFEPTAQGWTIKNATSVPINSLPIYDENGDIRIIQLSETLPEYSQAQINTPYFDNKKIKRLTLANQKPYFINNFNYLTMDNPCAEKTGVCHDGPKDEAERNIYDIVINNIYNSYNRKSLSDTLFDFFETHCSVITDAKISKAVCPTASTNYSGLHQRRACSGFESDAKRL